MVFCMVVLANECSDLALWGIHYMPAILFSALKIDAWEKAQTLRSDTASSGWIPNWPQDFGQVASLI